MKIIIVIQFLIYHLIGFLPFFTFPICLQGQQIKMKGIITIHNSKYKNGKTEYVSNAEIIAAFSVPATSGNDGRFNLEFVGIEGGTSVDISVEKHGYEVVNKRELQDVVISRRLPLKVFLARKGELAEAQTELYNVSLKALTARHNALIKALQKKGAERKSVIAALEDKLGKTIADRFEAEKLLSEKLIATKKRLPKLAEEMAAINLDFASEMYREAYEFFKQGEIEKVIETLDEAVLDKEAVDAGETLNRLEKDINDLDSARRNEKQRLDKTIESILLKARSLKDTSNFKGAISGFENVLSVMNRAGDTCQQRLSEIYSDIAEIYRETNDPQKELVYSLKHLDILEKMPEQKAIEMLKLYEEVGTLYQSQSNLDSVIFYKRKTYGISKNLFPANSEKVRNTRNELATLLEQYGQKLQQQNRFEKAIEVYNETLLLEPDNKLIKRAVRKLKRVYKQ